MIQPLQRYAPIMQSPQLIMNCPPIPLLSFSDIIVSEKPALETPGHVPSCR